MRRLYQLPQYIIGRILVKLIGKRRRADYKGVEVWDGTQRGSVSFGPIIIIGTMHNQNTLAHEYGHSRQSKILGPLYLFAVGLPSIMRVGWWRLRKLPGRDYYKGYPERWADKLGGVKRD